MDNNHECGQEQTVEEKCEDCICKVLSDLLDVQKNKNNKKEQDCSCTDSIHPKPVHKKEVIPFILQTPYGHPFFTWGNIGKDDCFATVFFTVLKVDCKKNCALLRLMKPNISMFDPETDCIESTKICEVKHVVPTKECILVKLNCYNAVKLTSPAFVKEQ